MTAQKDKGTKFETSLLPLLRLWWPDAARSALSGSADVGDFHLPGNSTFIVQAKNRVKMNLPEWTEQARKQAVNKGVPFGVVVHKRMKCTAPEQQWVTMTFGDFLLMVNMLSAGADKRAEGGMDAAA